MNKKKYFLLPVLCSIVLIALDQAVKYWAKTILKPEVEIKVIPGFFRFAYVENTGAAFGIFEGARWIFIALTIVVFIVLIVYYVRLPYKKEYWKQRVPLIFIFSGAVGNFIDRVANGYVIDMFEFTFISFPVFNIADMCLVLGTFVMAAVILFFTKEPSNTEQTEVNPCEIDSVEADANERS